MMVQEAAVVQPPVPLVFLKEDETRKTTGDNLVEKKENFEKIEWVLSQEVDPIQEKIPAVVKAEKNSPASAVSGGYLARPSNIYAEESRFHKESLPEKLPVKEPVLSTNAINPLKEEDPSSEMQLVFRDNIPAADEPKTVQAQETAALLETPAEEPAMQDEAEDQKRRASERINKLRNLSFNINGADPSNEFETVPAYIRRNLELYNTISNVENFLQQLRGKNRRK